MRTVSALIALALVTAAVPAAAQDGTSLAAAGLPAAIAAKLDAAMSQASSFRIRSSTASGHTSTVTIVRSQKRAKMTETDPVWGVVTETIFADGRAYTRSSGGEWRLIERPQRAPGMPSAAQIFMNSTKIAPLADRVENGAAVGAYEMDITPPSAGVQEPIRFTCLYDKTTYLLRSCANDVVTQTFEGWNDPANIVDVPVVAAPSSR